VGKGRSKVKQIRRGGIGKEKGKRREGVDGQEMVMHECT